VLGSRLARRIVLPLLGLIGVLFAILAVVAVWIADQRVEEELNLQADRIADTLDDYPAAAAHNLAALVDVEVVVEGPDGLTITRPDWTEEHLAGLAPGTISLPGGPFRVVERVSVVKPPRRYFVFTSTRQLARQRRDVLIPIVAAGAIGLLVAALLGVVVARTIARPVKALAETAGRFAGGEFEGRVARGGPGEIGDLEEALERMLQAIRDGEEKLRESERFAALGRLAGGIAHELRNPLTAIRMAVETALSDAETSREEGRAMALSELDRLERTLTELLDYVRPRKPKLEDVSLGELLGECVDLLRPQCEHLKVRLEIDTEDGAVVRADRDRLKQAALNLILNGAQAQPHGGVVRVTASGGEIAVADEGAGIPDGIKEKIFEPFITTRAAGIGLGLAVVRQVADEHGAALDFRTGQGGTTFMLRFCEEEGRGNRKGNV
jgi:signal transduction histidine kinase